MIYNRFVNHDVSMIVTETMRHVPLDITAAFFLLKNRKPTEWRHKQSIDQSVDMVFEGKRNSVLTPDE